MAVADLDVRLALRDERKNFGFAVGEALASWPIQSNRRSCACAVVTMTAASDRFDRGHESAGRVFDK